MFGNDFNIDKNSLKARINSIIIPENLEGFIFSLYNYYDTRTGFLDPNIKRLRGFYQSSYPLGAKYDANNDELTLSEEEIRLINNEYFENELENIYKNINTELFEFHWNYKKQKDELLLFYDELITRFSDDYFNAYHNGKITNLNSLKIKDFKLRIIEEFNNSKDLLLYLRYSLTNKYKDFEKNQIWYNIFKNEEIFHKFENYINDNILEPIADLSYVFQKMTEDGYIYKINHYLFIDWLLQNKFISEKDHDNLYDNKGFRSLIKSTSNERINKYNNYFKK